MNRSTTIAAWLAAFAAAVHLFAGTVVIHRPLLESALPEPLRLLLYVCWHLVSITLIGSALVLFLAVRAKTPAHWINAVRGVGVLWIGFALVFIGVGLVFSDPRALLVLPQWILLLPVGLLALAGKPAVR